MSIFTQLPCDNAEEAAYLSGDAACVEIMQKTDTIVAVAVLQVVLDI